MGMKVKTFESSDSEDLDERVNNWIARNPGIKVITISIGTRHHMWSFYVLTVLYEVNS